MNVGTIFLLISLLIFFFLGVGMTVIPRAEYWAWFCLVLGMLLAGWPLRPWPW